MSTVEELLAVERAVFNSAAQVTVAFLGVFAMMLSVQGVTSVRLRLQTIKKEKKHWDRYTDPRMLPYDRMVGNTLEWMPVFLGLFWVSMLASGGATLWYGWVYVAARALYGLLAVSGGVSRIGPRNKILLGTVPMYAMLVLLLAACVQHLW